ncbi:MAG: GatB/YqeY domain-containing protein [Thermoleophilaceae bacterium]|nr:GatB/YqeY domain-containing protein [Thermoleophilaceae bacterium]
MSVLDQIRADTVAAMKAGDRQRAGALRLISSELQKAAKEPPDGGLDETTVLRRERKRRTEAATAYRDAGRADLAAGEEAEAEILAGYLPAELSDEELAALVGDAVAESGATSVREMGKVMPLAMARVQGRADGRRVSAVVRERLGA